MRRTYSAMLILFVFMNCSVFGQTGKEISEVKDEISVSTNNLNFDNFSLKYARNISNNWWLKVGIINLGINSYKNYPYQGSFITTDTKINGSLLLGIDKEKVINEKLSMIMGLNAQMSYNYSNYKLEDPGIPVSQRDNKVYHYVPGIGFGLGFFYHIKNNLLLGAEINPTFRYYYEKSKSSYNNAMFTNKGFNFSLSNNSGFLTFKYRF